MSKDLTMILIAALRGAADAVEAIAVDVPTEAAEDVKTAINVEPDNAATAEQTAGPVAVEDVKTAINVEPDNAATAEQTAGPVAAEAITEIVPEIVPEAAKTIEKKPVNDFEERLKKAMEILKGGH